MKGFSFAASELAGVRLDAAVSRMGTDLSRAHAQKLIEDGKVHLDNFPELSLKPSYKLKEGDSVTVDDIEEITPGIVPQSLDIRIVYEDEDLAVVYKPRGMVVHPAAGHSDMTLVNGLMYALEGRLSGIGGVLRPGIVHRIDKDTSGLLMVCKTDRAHNAVSDMLKIHDIKREYEAVCFGIPDNKSGTVHAPIGRMKNDRVKMCVTPDGKDAVTHYEVLEEFEGFSHIRCVLETGRTHQIRVHMQSLGHPLLGDPLYGPRSPKQEIVKKIKAECPQLLEGQILHAGVLGFVHPISGEYLEFHEPLPDYFEKVLGLLREK